MFCSCVCGETRWPILKLYLCYKPPSSWRILFRSGGRPRQFSCLEKFRTLGVPIGGCCKETILQGIQLNNRFYCVRWSCLRIKLDHISMHPDRVIVHTDRWLEGLSMIPDSPNTLPHQSAWLLTTPSGTWFKALLYMPILFKVCLYIFVYW